MFRLQTLLAILMTSVLTSNSLADEPLRISGQTMGSYYAIVIDSPGAADGDQIQAEVEKRLAEITQQMSNWDDESEISRFNRSTSVDWIPVGKDFATVVTEAKRLHTATEGAIDITVTPLIDAWGFGKTKQRVIPTDAQIQEALKRVSMRHVDVRMEPPAIRKSLPQVMLNVSSLAPGYATDEVCGILNARGLKSHVVDVGGENRAGLAKANGDAWRLGVESPLTGMHKIVELTDQAIATSGDYRNFFVFQGKKYAHILDPKTGRPVENPPASVSVIHKSCMTADGLATAMMVLGAKDGMKVAQQSGVDVMFLDVDANGMLVEKSSGVFQAAEQ